jgi:hypothetical protein
VVRGLLRRRWFARVPGNCSDGMMPAAMVVGLKKCRRAGGVEVALGPCTRGRAQQGTSLSWWLILSLELYLKH